MDQIIIRDLHVRCIIGIQEWERNALQDVMISLTLFTDLGPAGMTDHIDATVNYKTLTKTIIQRVERSSFQLIEALAAEIARMALADPRVVRVRVMVDKPGALRFARSVGVDIERDRQWLASLS
ncbi:MAG: dihydroneopterin aldolase [Magnetococcales bacterium]|nr:dihydroneopterin aldolase [Magnetococcales bacterium]MBF0151430.1 dihydroneopterin aldolase [Magnetococcales bacterium]MBF0174388.1 dihydroneopterin aldolase [Magnetococcales bacterium]MBF0348800.1 dihydroneopterin aldolase [Magnetococcales bacterium]MBF0632786.1 dihydroneopterin aldolase [Magnetococcales bacterium]